MAGQKWILALAIILLVPVTAALAQPVIQEDGPAADNAGDLAANVPAADTEELDEAYVGRITGDSVNVRSGPGQVYYAVTQLDQGQLVIVRAERHGRHNWAQIDPPVGSFSFIAKEFVEIMVEAAQPATQAEADDGEALHTRPMLGRVTGNNVRVRAGAISVPPENADQVQTRLNRGAVVEIIGEQDDYYKIVCPAGTRYWISLDYVQRVGPVTEELATSLAQEAQQTAGETTEQLSQAQMDRQEYHAIVDLLAQEQAKEISDQDFAPIRSRLETLEAQTQYDNIRLDSQQLLRRLARSELVLDIWRRAQDREAQLQETLDRITATTAEARASQAYSTDTAAPVMMVRLTPAATRATIDGKRVYQVRDASENILCYAVAMHDRLDLQPYVGNTVSLAGYYRTGSNTGGLRVLYVTSVVREVEPTIEEPQSEVQEVQMADSTETEH
ncbi:MAG: hypothetical protein JW936_10755 [Sedimentisphaerales bacterium]|nr:hypothetical protein [Sedimentisphaerales bacterium]